uniref:Uncharacterized protein n=1 Tax=Lactuca sativa TaxID=4236 RepID=A0A9R1W2R2_LACSA|nr:hypothetical protein LSAT_V11C300148340 [Lactuca sativa]
MRTRQQPSVNHADYRSQTPSWLFDTDSNNHVASDLSSIGTVETYYGNDSLHVRNDWGGEFRNLPQIFLHFVLFIDALAYTKVSRTALLNAIIDMSLKLDSHCLLNLSSLTVPTSPPQQPPSEQSAAVPSHSEEPPADNPVHTYPSHTRTLPSNIRQIRNNGSLMIPQLIPPLLPSPRLILLPSLLPTSRQGGGLKW